MSGFSDSGFLGQLCWVFNPRVTYGAVNDQTRRFSIECVCRHHEESGENTIWTGGSSVLGLRYETMEGEVIDLQTIPPIQEYFFNSLPHGFSLEIKYHMV